MIENLVTFLSFPDIAENATSFLGASNKRVWVWDKSGSSLACLTLIY